MNFKGPKKAARTFATGKARKALWRPAVNHGAVIEHLPENENADKQTIKSEKIALALEVALQYLDLNHLNTEEDKFHNLCRALNDIEQTQREEQGDSYDYWLDQDATSIGKATNAKNILKPIKIIGQLSQVTVPQPFKICDRTAEVRYYTIVDQKGNRIDTMPVPEGILDSEVVGLKNQKKTCTFMGGVVPAWKKKVGQYFFFLTEMRNDVSAWDLIDERPIGKFVDDVRMKIGSEIVGIEEDHPYHIISQHEGTNEILKCIKSELVNDLGIKGLDHAKELDLCIEFMILQAFSEGKDKFSQKLHSLVIGPPNVGKGFLTKIALILNPVAQELSSTSLKLTAAGLIGSAKRDNKNVSVPGIIPNCSGGVVCIQEFHDVKGNKRREVISIFNRFMEEGILIDSTTNNTVHKAETSLHLDENRLSQINPDRNYDTYCDFDIPVNTLSRFDFIAEIPRDSERQAEVAAAMTDVKSLGPGGSKLSYVERTLKMLVAWMRSKHRVVSFSENVNNHMGKQLEKALAPLKADSSKADIVQAMELRLTNSVYKLVKAIACANATTEAREDFVDYAMKFVQSKIEFIGSISPGNLPAQHPNVNDQPARQELIRREFSGKEQFTVADVLNFVRDKMDGNITDRTLIRDLKDLGAKLVNKKKGLWSL
jgi:hypothetical protein